MEEDLTYEYERSWWREFIGRCQPPIIKWLDMSRAMIWYYHNTAGLLLVGVTLLRFSLLLPFFRRSSHPRTHTFLGRRGGAQPRQPSLNPLQPSLPTTHPADTLQPPELWGSIHEEACKGSADATRLSTSFEHGLPRQAGPSTAWWLLDGSLHHSI